MRKLTLNEKINFRYAMKRKGIALPIITMGVAKYFWTMCYGYLPMQNHYLFASGEYVDKDEGMNNDNT